MPHSHPDLRTLRRVAGVLGAGALIAVGTVPGAMAEDAQTGLVLGTIAPISGVKPGGTFEAPVAFTNTGSEALEKVWLSYAATQGLSHTDMPSNCARWDVGSYDEMLSRSTVICEFDQTVKPGVGYAPEKPLVLKATDQALYDDLYIAVANSTIYPDENAQGPVRGTGPAVGLAEQPAGSVDTGNGSSNPDWDSASVRVNTDNTADFKVEGAELKGRVGATVSGQVKFTNTGPAWVMHGLEGSVTRMLIKIPAGTTVVDGLKSCKNPSAGTYDCGTVQYWLDKGEVQTYPFKLKINKAVPGAKGSASLPAASRPYDVNKANDKADILLHVEGSGSTGGSSSGGSGSSGGSTSTGGSGATGGSGSTGGGATTTSGSSTTGSSGSTSSAGGDLADTGSGLALPLAGAAAVVLGAGAGAVLLVRRRAARR